jgi:hypothetical protein
MPIAETPASGSVAQGKGAASNQRTALEATKAEALSGDTLPVSGVRGSSSAQGAFDSGSSFVILH